jgi:hypothetical protein
MPNRTGNAKHPRIAAIKNAICQEVGVTSINTELKNMLTLAEPLGPIAHERMGDEVADDLVYHKIALFSDVTNKPHMLFLGRKGAGKSALLREIRLGTRRKPSKVVVSHERFGDTSGAHVIAVFSWRHFHQIVRNVRRQYRNEESSDELIPPEYFTELWRQTLWDEIFQHFYKEAHEGHHRDLLKPVDQYINVDGFFDGTPEDQARVVFENARKCVLDFLAKTRSTLYFLFDSMDEYPVRNATFSRILSGLFQGLTQLSDESSRIVVSFFIPEEIENFNALESSNLMKDLSASFRIRWNPIDLLRVVAHRLRISASVYDAELHDRIKDFDLSRRQDIHQLFQMVLPPRIKNSQGTEEDTLAYIIRHTQLLPRHILAIFNSALSIHYKAAQSFAGVSPEAIRAGVSAVQKLIANQILLPFEHLYPKLLTQCRAILPDLDPICDFSTLRKVEARFHRLIEEEVGSVWTKLFDMGVIGRSTGHDGNNSHQVEQSDRYCYGQFHFNIDGSFGLATDGEYCFHPVFTRAFGMVRRSSDKRVVYPAHIILEGLYDGATG